MTFGGDIQIITDVDTNLFNRLMELVVSDPISVFDIWIQENHDATYHKW